MVLAWLLVLAALTGCAASGAQSVGSSSETESFALSTRAGEDVSALEIDPADGAVSAPARDTDRVKALVASMTQEEKIYQLFIVTQEQLTGTSRVTQSGRTTRKAIRRQPVGGIIYFEPNIVSPDQCKEMISNLQSYTKLGLFIAVDEEGGRVARLGNNPDMGTTAFSGGQAAIGSTGDPEKAHSAGRTIGEDISRFGFNLNLAPVAEITDDVEHSVIGERSFGGDVEMTAKMVTGMVTGLHEGGVLCTLKHFPGHGDTSSDPHNGYSEMSKPLEELREKDFVPFRAGVQAGADCLMMGHFSSPQITGDDTPATLSADMIALAREELSFDGLIMTDSLSMGAITDRYSSAEAATKALEAGADIILMPYDLDSAVRGIQEALERGDITQERIDESVEKILLKKLEYGIVSEDWLEQQAAENAQEQSGNAASH